VGDYEILVVNCPEIVGDSKTNRIILESKAIANKTMPISLSKLSEYGKKAVVVTVFVKSGTSLYKRACQSFHAAPLSDS
jgi:hypothetical protein